VELHGYLGRFAGGIWSPLICAETPVKGIYGWVNHEAVPEPGDGVDPVASQVSPKQIRVPGMRTTRCTFPSNG
jgi:hypothetical protein